MDISLYCSTLKGQYILSPHCPRCGVFPLYRGHTCGNDGVKDHCPGCGKLLVHIKAGDLLFRAERCTCHDECGFCPECCKLLESPVVATLT